MEHNNKPPQQSSSRQQLSNPKPSGQQPVSREPFPSPPLSPCPSGEALPSYKTQIKHTASAATHCHCRHQQPLPPSTTTAATNNHCRHQQPLPPPTTTAATSNHCRHQQPLLRLSLLPLAEDTLGWLQMQRNVQELHRQLSADGWEKSSKKSGGSSSSAIGRLSGASAGATIFMKEIGGMTHIKTQLKVHATW